jgi:hypothetical protein
MASRQAYQLGLKKYGVHEELLSRTKSGKMKKAPRVPPPKGGKPSMVLIFQSRQTTTGDVCSSRPLAAMVMLASSNSGDCRSCFSPSFWVCRGLDGDDLNQLPWASSARSPTMRATFSPAAAMARRAASLDPVIVPHAWASSRAPLPWLGSPNRAHATHGERKVRKRPRSFTCYARPRFGSGNKSTKTTVMGSLAVDGKI